MTRKHFLASLASAGAAAALVDGQTLGSKYDPQILEFTLEARVPLANILSDGFSILSNLPEQVVAGIRSGSLEIRGRVDYIRSARAFRIYQMLTPASAPLGNQNPPDVASPAVVNAFDLGVDSISWFEWANTPTSTRVVATVLGRRLESYKGNMLEDEPGVIQFCFHKGQPTRLGMFTLAYAGAVALVAPNPVGSILLDTPFRY
jgi:hypothetical protein